MSKGWTKIALLALTSAAVGAAGSVVVQQKFSEPKAATVQKVEKPKPAVVQPKKELPKAEAPKPGPKEDPSKKQPVAKSTATTKPEPQQKSTGPSRKELKKFWNRMYELNGMLNNVDSDGFFAQYEISWIEEVRKQLHSMRVPNDPQAKKYYRVFKDRMDTVWYWIIDGNDDMQAQRVLNDWGYESQLLFADEYKDEID